MIEPIMYLAIGFLVSMLFGLMVLPLVHNRAVRLTTRKLEAATPISMAEIQADKDQLRAEFAMSARRLEMSVEQLKNKTTTQSAELGKKSDAINRMKLELGEKSAAIFSLETREQAVRDQLRAAENEVATRLETLRTAETALSDKQAELSQLNNNHAARPVDADLFQVDPVAGASGIASLLSQRVQELEAILASQTQLLAERDDENARLRDNDVSAVRIAGDTAGVHDGIQTDRVMTDEQLRLVTEDRGRLQRELNAIQQQAESAWATERMENALLRERINDIAAEVAKLAMTLEGPNSTIEAMLAAAPVTAVAPNDTADGEPRGTLADRIRALQSHASRAREAT